MTPSPTLECSAPSDSTVHVELTSRTRAAGIEVLEVGGIYTGMVIKHIDQPQGGTPQQAEYADVDDLGADIKVRSTHFPLSRAHILNPRDVYSQTSSFQSGATSLLACSSTIPSFSMRAETNLDLGEELERELNSKAFAWRARDATTAGAITPLEGPDHAGAREQSIRLSESPCRRAYFGGVRTMMVLYGPTR